MGYVHHVYVYIFNNIEVKTNVANASAVHVAHAGSHIGQMHMSMTILKVANANAYRFYLLR
ncbi:hypothetical protein Pint_26821 [Pistacia integerrima]|uniref:Uncharacterized protein n=1 Tax=Pistacia integerrima TaxID=434235 RepID=A0ACC0YRA6_9ROSI|nr:hypothetical protein Pint_26821 [Pistacia integerrima]